MREIMSLRLSLKIGLGLSGRATPARTSKPCVPEVTLPWLRPPDGFILEPSWERSV